ncbi:MAG: hypothetical protein AAF191_17010 [Verrucomicrobiota bacterium]
MMIRRRFLESLAVATTPPLVSAAASSKGTKAPFQILYCFDTTHIRSCLPPDDPRRQAPFTDDDLRSSIREAAGVDAHFLQPGLGWMPWWKSEIYSAEDHYSWLQEGHGVRGVTKFGNYLLHGGDLLQTLVDTCRQMGIAPFLSFRLNDGHHTRDLADALHRGRPTSKMAAHYFLFRCERCWIEPRRPAAYPIDGFVSESRPWRTSVMNRESI